MLQVEPGAGVCGKVRLMRGSVEVRGGAGKAGRGLGRWDPCLPGSRLGIVSWSVWTQWRVECESTWVSGERLQAGDSEGLAEAAEKKEKEGAEFQRKPGF